MNGRIVERWANWGARASASGWNSLVRSTVANKKKKKKNCSQQPGTLTRNLR
jgi:hypothetical protein